MGAVCDNCIDDSPRPVLPQPNPSLKTLRSVPEHVPQIPSTESKKIDFNQKRFIGKTEYGLVMAVTLRNDPKNTIYAMKILMKDKLPPINTSVIFKQQLPHSDFLVDIIQISEEDKRINILMEYMESRDLNYYRKKAGVFPEKTIRGVAAEVLVALEYLHSHNIIYKFLKPQNIMLTNEGHVKLTDYVLSNIIDISMRILDPVDVTGLEIHSATTKPVKSNSLITLGSVEYMAPCMFKPDKQFTQAVDVWTFGILLYELKNGHTPFGGQDPQSIRDQIEKGNYEFQGQYSVELRNLIEIILVKDAAARPAIEAIKQHPFFREIVWDTIVNRTNEPPMASYRQKYNVKFEQPIKITERVLFKQSLESTKQTTGLSLNEDILRNK